MRLDGAVDAAGSGTARRSAPFYGLKRSLPMLNLVDPILALAPYVLALAALFSVPAIDR
jgi:hypothetical protein